ncbi:hypothetical protein BP6252_04346 [Coleophoma cylindrospora]|uniref:SET domain-containing protein n=1 Tax=Coleophoma cylindrospora TaxID=1849047 RepID=A0A3D8S0A6_9HELO|nr:hypothetical protein BP6252_04346 [Coleophoma cylindrospora]
MTERLLHSTTQLAHPIQAVFHPANPVQTGDAPPISESVEEEPYTIKCICDYSDDDGNTIYCETCDTWQHIECFYPGRVDDAAKEEFDHSCMDCKPRLLDGRHATERQRQQRQNKANNEGNEKKGKRPLAKSHKKKTKPSDLQVNGGNPHDHDVHKHNSPQDHNLPIKAKGHRSSKSVNSVAKRSPSYNSKPQNTIHPPSPAHTPPDLPNGFEVHGYSENFLILYKDDHDTTTEANTYSSLAVSNAMSSWLHDPNKLRLDTGVENGDEVFYKVKVGLDELKWPDLQIEHKTDTLFNDTVLQWRFIVTPKQLPPSSRIGELNGLVGFQRDYVSDPENRWQDTPHPRPFVFFHPRLPIFIDTRRQGSKCRYVRRSCRPNTSLEIYTIADSAEYHFWLISDGALAPNEQITLGWDFRFPSDVHSRFVRLLNLADDEGLRSEGTDLSEEEYNIISDVIHQVLSDHGGCACDLGSNCQFARFHRNYRGRIQASTNGARPKKGRKQKVHTSPNSTGQATNSRAASEGHQDPENDDDIRSMSGSVKGKPRSRDMTPLLGIRDMNGNLPESSDREKRKLAMEEQLFQKQAEQGQPPRKKKRASEVSNINSSLSAQTSLQTPKQRQKSVAQRSTGAQSTSSNTARGRQYVDAGTSRRQSGSPYSGISPTTALPSLPDPSWRRESPSNHSRQPSPSQKYVDSCTQTDSVENAWFSRHNTPPRPRKNIITLSQRLLKNRQRLRAQQEAYVKPKRSNSTNGEDDASVGSSASPAMELDTSHGQVFDHDSVGSPSEVRGRAASIASSTPSMDTPSCAMDAQGQELSTNLHSIKPPPPQWSTSSFGTGAPDVGGQGSPSMKLQMPPAPVFATPLASGSPTGSVTPSAATSSTAQSPYASNFSNNFASPVTNGVIHPSPVKTTKKLSLSDYKARRKLTDSSSSMKPSVRGSPTAPGILKPVLAAVEETKALGILDDTVVVERGIDPMDLAGDNTSTPKEPLPSDGTNGIL